VPGVEPNPPFQWYVANWVIWVVASIKNVVGLEGPAVCWVTALGLKLSKITPDSGGRVTVIDSGRLTVLAGDAESTA
jgi:hypothetical protein